MHQLTRLRKQVLQYKVLERGAVDDFCLSSPAGATFDEAAAKKRVAEIERPKAFPPSSKVAVFPLLRFRPYHRLDLKYQKLFGQAVAEHTKAKEEARLNFTKTTRMVLELSTELSLIKQVIENIEGDFSTNFK